MLNPSGPADSLLQSTIHRLARCWRIRRTDARVFRFTDHDTDVEFAGELYESAGGMDVSANRLQDSLNASNFEAMGPITSDKITLDDLRIGRWQDAEVVEYLVDWMYPQTGARRAARFWMTQGEWDGEKWAFEIEGGTRWLRSAQGFLFSRNCPWEHGAGRLTGRGCTVDIDGLAIRDAQLVSVTSNVLFRGGSQIPVGHTKERYRFGKVLWTKGENEGVVREIKDYVEGTRDIKLFIPTPFDIDPLDRFDLFPGCDKIRSTCKTEYANIPEFRGFPFMPGTNRILMKPKGTASPPTKPSIF